MGTFVINQLEASSCFVLALLYFLTGIYTAQKLRFLHQRSLPGLSTNKLLVMSIFLIALTRLLSFIAMTLLQLWNVEIKDSESEIINFSHQHSVQNSDKVSSGPFYEKTILVLFDLPDFLILSSYTLLVLVWLEAFLQSRLHWLSNERYRRLGLFAYMVFNTILYSGQVTIYGFLFVPSANQSLLQAILYVSLTTLNFVVILGYVLIYTIFAVMFAGFPSRSFAATNRLNAITKSACSWTLARIVWALFALTSVVKGWLLETGVSSQVSSIILVALFILTEIMPFLGVLNYSFISIVEMEPTDSINQDSPRVALMTSTSEI